MSAAPLLSIVVPTRDRAETALRCIAALSAIPGDDIEIVVSDCGLREPLGEAVARLGDPRIRYAAQPPCSMTENWNHAYALSRGDYVSFIGDDDAFLPHGPAVVRRLAAQGVDAIAYPYRASYFWDNFPDPRRAGTLVLAGAGTTAAADRREDARAAMRQMLRTASAPPLPVVYHGVVARRVLDRVVARAGHLFDTRAPDTFASAALCSVLDRYVVVDRPLSMFGKSGKSNSAAVVDGSEQAEHRLQFAAAQRAWHPLTPPAEGIEAYVADSYGAAFRAMGDAEFQALYVGRFLGSAYADSLLRNPRRTAAIVAHYWQRARPADARIVGRAFVAGLAARVVERIGARLTDPLRAPAANGEEHLPVASFEAAIALVEARLA